jgi:predicted DCC family thiol-disulfide oxidoreductase YuxK
MSQRPARATLIYDGRCPFCRNCVAWVRERDAGHAFDFLPFQHPDLPARFPQVSLAACERAVMLVGSDGSLRSGPDALPHILRELPGWRVLAPLLSRPALRPLVAWLYEIIATRRLRDIETPPES